MIYHMQKRVENVLIQKYVLLLHAKWSAPGAIQMIALRKDRNDSPPQNTWGGPTLKKDRKMRAPLRGE